MYIYIYIYMLSGPGPQTPPPPPPGPGPRPAPEHSNRTTGTNPRKQGGGRTMENDPSKCFFTERRTASEQGHGAPFARRKEHDHILYSNEHVTMTSIPYLCRTAPHRRGGANQNDHRPQPTGGEGTRHVTIPL